ncbi:MAG: prolipoprotein diacylglyceryl transferase [Bdellovibrionales bacterium]|nr:prolipoprotein diacylglyceryl transferase [Bdellovibrionales bacterium]NQZ19279.1 prolipoprotein diacylglyceryl transferase [Bdellovibrionales bacterium]
MDYGLPASYTIGPLPQIHIGELTLPSYYAVISIACTICVYWFYRRCDSRNLNNRNAMDISLLILIIGFIGARLAHVLFEFPQYYLEHPIEILYFWQGVFVFYGGAILGYLSAAFYARRLKMTFWLWHDTLAPVMALGYAIGRVACFLEGCCYGKVCNLPWAIHLHEVDSQGIMPRALSHPTHLYAIGTELITLAVLLFVERRRPNLGVVFLLWVIP